MVAAVYVTEGGRKINITKNLHHCAGFFIYRAIERAKINKECRDGLAEFVIPSRLIGTINKYEMQDWPEIADLHNFLQICPVLVNRQIIYN